MPLLLGTKGNDVMQWSGSVELLTSIKKSLVAKLAGSSGREAASMLEKFAGSLQDELTQEAAWLGELADCRQALDAAPSLEQLPTLQERYRQLLADHFHRRGSVLAFCGAADDWHDRILAKAVSLAQSAAGDTSVHALLASGTRGRLEQTFRGENSYFLLHAAQGSPSLPFRAQLESLLLQAGLLQGRQTLWHGSLSEWQALLESISQPAEQREPPTPLPFEAPLQSRSQQTPGQQWQLESMTDLSFLQGEAPLAQEALQLAEQAIQQQRWRDPFIQLSRRVLGLPLAIGHFGRWRLQRSGAHRGELDLEEFALGPLVACIRVLAVHAEIGASGTVARIQTLLAKGALDVELAERLLKAYQCFMQLKIRHEIDGKSRGAFCIPAQLGEAELARFKGAIQAVLSLQKIGYQRIVGQG